MKILQIVAKTKNKIKYLLVNFFLRIKLIGKNFEIIWLGNNYGGFYVASNKLNNKSIVYSFGIGTDISFDSDLINFKKITVYGFDPTPKSIDWISKNKMKNFIFFDYGIGNKNETAKMYLPKNKNHVSGSILKNKNLSKNYIKVKLKTLDSIMKELNHKYLNLLKLDIEGAELDVLQDILNKNINVNQIIVEFHDRFLKNGKKARRHIMKELQEKGYSLFAISNSFQEYSFIKK